MQAASQVGEHIRMPKPLEFLELLRYARLRFFGRMPRDLLDHDKLPRTLFQRLVHSDGITPAEGLHRLSSPEPMDVVGIHACETPCFNRQG